VSGGAEAATGGELAEGMHADTERFDVAVVRPPRRLRGDIRLPGDKSVSHRALLLAALADGESRIAGASDGQDVRSTAGIVERLGATVERVAADGRTVDYRVVSPGVDGLVEPDGVLDCGNSGTSLRLVAGVLAGLPGYAVLDGDDSLRRRPVARIIEPLRSMGAELHARRGDSLPPLTVVGHTPLRAVELTTPVPSAQVKSAILLAALRADGRTTVRERIATRDHTERMLRARGVPVERLDAGDGAAPAAVSALSMRCQPSASMQIGSGSGPLLGSRSFSQATTSLATAWLSARLVGIVPLGPRFAQPTANTPSARG